MGSVVKPHKWLLLKRPWEFVKELFRTYLVYAAVLSHLQQHQTAQSCFLNRNSKDFDDPDLVEELNIHNCKLLARFDTGYQFILSHLSQDSESA